MEDTIFSSKKLSEQLANASAGTKWGNVMRNYKINTIN